MQGAATKAMPGRIGEEPRRRNRLRWLVSSTTGQPRRPHPFFSRLLKVSAGWDEDLGALGAPGRGRASGPLSLGGCPPGSRRPVQGTPIGVRSGFDEPDYSARSSSLTPRPAFRLARAFAILSRKRGSVSSRYSNQSSSDPNPTRTPAGFPCRVMTILSSSASRRYFERSSFTSERATLLIRVFPLLRAISLPPP